MSQDVATTPRHTLLGWSDDEVIRVYRLMVLARRMSERTLTLARQGRVHIAVPSEGHEAAQIGAVLALRPEDSLYVFYRGMASALARGQTARQIMLDHFGRAAATNGGGRPMPCHWSDPSLRLITNSSSVGTHIPHAVGTALASKLRGEAAVSFATFGEGAVSKGDFHEGLNFAAIHHVPVILLCENNRYAISVPFRLESPVSSVADRAAAYGIRGVSVDGMDIFAVNQAVREARERALAGEGPTVIEARVYRFSLHTSHVGIENYREQAEIQREREHDPLPAMRTYLLGLGLLTESDADGLLRGVNDEIDAAVDYAERSAPPLADTATRHVLAS
ncbi:MAG: thiamine pyrophosphate-dependent dehydrogenase E1 component subunit alpha [Chloroflexota bacterium]